MWLTYLYNIFIKPIELIVEFIFVVLYRQFHSSGWAILGVSLVINFLVLPIYRQADAAQEEERRKQEEMKPRLEMINRAFRGDERYMMLAAYYREAGYHPVYALRGVLPILLQIPFFIAAFHFLSGLGIMEGESFWILKDLGAPDDLLVLGSVCLHLLPILMTCINILSGMIYLKGFPLKNKIQTYVLAVVFLFLLYGSPSGLVLYWTMNNLFSLGKNIVMKLIMPRKEENVSKETETKQGLGEFVPTQLCFIVLLGLVVPAALVASSAGEFILVGDYRHPIHYVISTFCIAIGYFGVWGTVFYLLSSDRLRRLICIGLAALGCAAVADYMFFGKELGILSGDLLFDGNWIHFSKQEKMVNSVTVLIIIASVIIFWIRKSNWMKRIMLVITVALMAVSLNDCIKIMRSVAAMDPSLREVRDQEEPIFRLSRTGTNVMIICLDAAMGIYVPYILAEKPEIREAFDGFVFYPNTVSFGRFTSVGSQGVWGGYEYVPSIADRDLTKNQETKRYEADTMLARVFGEAGYEVTACDIPYAGFQDVSNPSAFEGIQGVTALNTMGYYTDGLEVYENDRQRAFFMYAVMKSVPVVLQSTVYDAGRYFSANGLLKLSGGQSRYFEAVGVLEKLADLTEITDEEVNTCLLLNNDTAHEPIRLQIPDYDKEPDATYDTDREEEYYRIDERGNVLRLNMSACYYHSSVSAYLRLMDFFTFLKENGVYDNTRIIIVADHGKPTHEMPNLLLEDPYGLEDFCDIMQMQPVLMVKDFQSHGLLSEDYSFMTNADTPTLAVEGLIEDPVNPYTGNPINNDEKYLHDQVIIYPGGINLRDPDSITYDEEGEHWISVHDNLFDPDNWEWLR